MPWPYDITPQQLLQPVQQSWNTNNPVSFPQMTPASYGPQQGATWDAFRGSMQRQLDVPGLLSQMMSNPAMAQRLGGLLSPQRAPMPQMAPAQSAWSSQPQQAPWAQPAAAGGGDPQGLLLYTPGRGYHYGPAWGPAYTGDGGSAGSGNGAGEGGGAGTGQGDAAAAAAAGTGEGF